MYEIHSHALTNLKDHSSFLSYLEGNIQMGNEGCEIGPIVNVCWKKRESLMISYVQKKKKKGKPQTAWSLKMINST